MTATEDSVLADLIAALTWEEWFERLPIIMDRFLDLDDQDGADAVRVIVREGRKPLKSFISGRYFWNGYYEKTTVPKGSLPNPMVLAIDKINGESLTADIAPQLTGFIAAWKQGLRP